MFDIRNAAILFIKLVIATQKQINDLISGRKKTVNFIQFTVQNMKFSIKDLFSKCEMEWKWNGKLHFLCSDNSR